MVVLVLFVALTGLAAGRVHGDSNFLVASLGVAPVLAFNVQFRRCIRLGREQDGPALLRAVTLAERLMWPTVTTSWLLSLRYQACELVGDHAGFDAHLRAVARRSRATPIAAVRLAMREGDVARATALAHAVLVGHMPAEDQSAAANLMARLDLPATLDWYASRQSGTARRGDPVPAQLAMLAAGGRVDAVDALTARLNYAPDDRARLHAEAEEEHRADELSTEQQRVLDQLETDTQHSVTAFAADVGGWRPYATWAICGVLAAVFAVQLARGSLDDQHLYDMGAFLTGNGSIEWWRAVTAAYLHGSVAHILFNVVALTVLGRFAEARLGRVRFVLTWLVTASGSFVVLGIVHAHRVELTVGASGGVMGLLGASIAVLLLQRRHSPSPLAERQLRLFGVLALLQLVLDSAVPNVSQTGHVAGFAIGAAIGLAVGLSPVARPVVS